MDKNLACYHTLLCFCDDSVPHMKIAVKMILTDTARFQKMQGAWLARPLGPKP